jgi:hypothetical protein
LRRSKHLFTLMPGLDPGIQNPPGMPKCRLDRRVKRGDEEAVNCSATKSTTA